MENSGFTDELVEYAKLAYGKCSTPTCLSNVDLDEAFIKYGAVLLHGHKHGFIGFVCPKCLKLTLCKYEANYIDHVKEMFVYPTNKVRGVIGPRLRYSSFPYHFLRDDPEQFKFTNYISEYFETGQKEYFEEEDFIDFELFEDSDLFCSYQLRDWVLGEAALIIWATEKDIQKIVNYENENNIKYFPRYTLFDPIYPAIERFCYFDQLSIEYVKGLKSKWNVQITNPLCPAKSRIGGNFEFLSILDAVPTDPHMPVEPAIYLTLSSRPSDMTRTFIYHSGIAGEKPSEGKHLRSINAVWNAFNNEVVQDLLTRMKSSFVAKYLNICQKIDFSPEDIKKLISTNLNQLYEAISTPTSRPIIERKVRKEEQKEVELAEKAFPSVTIISQNHVINEIKLEISKVGKLSEYTIDFLLLGESGTGKELFAKAIHEASGRKGAFIPVNCANIPDNLFESEFFGYVKGAFTDAKDNKKGYFEEAAGGTIFMDEIGEIDIRFQPKLLRVIQEREIQPMGAARPKKVDIRIVFATNRDLANMVEEGCFRLDLFHRINSFTFRIPALRDRKEDIPLLVIHFLNNFNLKEKKSDLGPLACDDSFFELAMIHSWLGNIRELENLIERIVINRIGDDSRADISASDFSRYKSDAPTQKASPQFIPTKRGRLPKDEGELLRLEDEGRSRAEIGRIYGVSREAVSRRFSKMKKDQ